MADAFISYSRLDREFVGQLRDALANEKQHIWIDWESIPPSQAWWSEIKKGILQANNFLIVLSENSMSSPICQMEIEYARAQGKRIIPVFYDDFQRDDALVNIAKRLADSEQEATRSIWESRQAHDLYDANQEAISKINYFFFRAEDDFGTQFKALLKIIQTDYDYVNQHTSYQIRAEQWAQRNQDTGLLLVDTELNDARLWLNTGEGKTPVPTQLQYDYIAESYAADRRRRRLTRTTRASIVVLIIALIIGGLSASSIVTRTQTQVAEGEATLVAIGTAVRDAQDFADSLRLAAQAQDVYDNGDQLLGIRLAYEASLISDAFAVQRILSNLAYQPGLQPPLINDLANIIALSPDGTTLLTSLDNEITLYDVQTTEAIRRFDSLLSEDYMDWLVVLEFHPNGDNFLSLSTNGDLLLRNLDNGEIIQRFQEDSNYLTRATSAAISPDGQLIAAGIRDGSAMLWESKTGALYRQFTGHSDNVDLVAISPDSRIFATVARPHSPISPPSEIFIWDIESGERLVTLSGHQGLVNAIAFSPDAEFLVTGGGVTSLAPIPGYSEPDRPELILWDMSSGAIRRSFEGHTSVIRHLIFDGRTILSLGDDLFLWRIDNNAIIKQFSGYPVNDFVWGRDNQTVFAAHENGISQIDVESGLILDQIDDYNNVVSVVFSSDNRYIAFFDALGANSELALYDVLTRNITKPFTRNYGPFSGVLFSPTQNTLLTTGIYMILLDVPSGESIQMYEAPPVSSSTNAQFSDDGQKIISASEQSLIIWDVNSGKIIESYVAPVDEIWSLSTIADTDTILSRSPHDTLLIWDIVTGTYDQLEHNALSNITNVLLSPDNPNHIIGASGSEIVMWHKNTGEIIQRFQGHSSFVASMMLSADGRKMVSGSSQGTIILWDLNTGEIIRRYPGHRTVVDSLAISPNGQMIASGTSDGIFTLWHDHNLEQMQQWIRENRYMPALTCEQRVTYGLEPCSLDQ